MAAPAVHSRSGQRREIIAGGCPGGGDVSIDRVGKRLRLDADCRERGGHHHSIAILIACLTQDSRVMIRHRPDVARP
jgi:hypothetical protein